VLLVRDQQGKRPLFGVWLLDSGEYAPESIGGYEWIHPDQVAVLNRVFTPDPAKVEYARRVVEAFEDGVRRGTASVNLDGKMVDVPVYKRAQVIMARARLVAETEQRKAAALAKTARGALP
jgi:hypothetical protein